MISDFFTTYLKWPNKCTLLKRDQTILNRMASIFSFAFMDLETTGLPFLENNTTKITELNVTIVESQHLRLGVYPRVRNKLHLCLNPCKFISTDSTNITNLSNEILENQPCFSLDVVNTINHFLNLSKGPICLVAHNGNKFDFPILKAELKRVNGVFSDDILYIDSLECFKNLHYKLLNDENEVDEVVPFEKRLKVESENEICTGTLDEDDQMLCAFMDEYEKKLEMSSIQKLNETTPRKQIIQNKNSPCRTRRKLSNYFENEKISFKLVDIYKRLTLKEPHNSHDAEGDVECLIYCAASYGENFIDWANKNAKLFTNVMPMRPGIPIWKKT